MPAAVAAGGDDDGAAAVGVDDVFVGSVVDDVGADVLRAVLRRRPVMPDGRCAAGAVAGDADDAGAVAAAAADAVAVLFWVWFGPADWWHGLAVAVVFSSLRLCDVCGL